jgi:hypothetical protein
MNETPDLGFLPVNLTARSEPVRGNPITARPESGADNAHPGLEFDTRVLNRIFFPGLVFDFQYGLGAKLIEVHPERSPDGLGGLKQKHLDDQAGIFLWYVIVERGHNKTREVYEIFGLDGYRVLRIVTSLEKGPLIVVIGPPPEKISRAVIERVTLMVAGFVLDSGQWPERSTITEESGMLQVAVLSGTRAEYLDENGVISPDAIEPGQLTQSLCSPWQWDFAECACYYWAASRPDIVVGEEVKLDSAAVLPPAEEVSFLRRDRSTRELPVRVKPPAERMKAWQASELSPPETILKWESLPFVINDRESVRFEAGRWPSPQEQLGPNEVIARLGQLAQIEHAILVEYLYAAYSMNSILMPFSTKDPGLLNAPGRQLPRIEEQLSSDVFAAANEILVIAVDEMRHFRWANEVRFLLGATEPELGRALHLNPVDSGTGRTFTPRPLTRAVLNELIELEARSRRIKGEDNTPEGIYTEILLNIHQWSQEKYPDRTRIMEILKTIIDEGEDHHRRLLSVRTKLERYEESEYLRVHTSPVAARDPGAKRLQDLGDRYYEEILEQLALSLRKSGSQRANAKGEMLRDARRSMIDLHDVAMQLSAAGEGVLFTLPKWLA